MSKRKDPVTPEIYERVVTRDLLALFQASEYDLDGPRPFRIDQALATLKGIALIRYLRDVLRDQRVCIAPLIDTGEVGRCSGRTTLDHVHDQMGVGKPRAKSDLDHLVSLCEGHTERGAKAGHIWNTAHRQELRDYLRRVNARQEPIPSGATTT